MKELRGVRAPSPHIAKGGATATRCESHPSTGTARQKSLTPVRWARTHHICIYSKNHHADKITENTIQIFNYLGETLKPLQTRQVRYLIILAARIILFYTLLPMTMFAYSNANIVIFFAALYAYLQNVALEMGKQ